MKANGYLDRNCYWQNNLLNAPTEVINNIIYYKRCIVLEIIMISIKDYSNIKKCILNCKDVKYCAIYFLKFNFKN